MFSGPVPRRRDAEIAKWMLGIIPKWSLIVKRRGSRRRKRRKG